MSTEFPWEDASYSEEDRNKNIIKQSQNLFIRSGEMLSRDPLEIFLYVLIRDEVSPGRIEELMMNRMPRDEIRTEQAVANGWLLKYARDIAERIRNLEGP